MIYSVWRPELHRYDYYEDGTNTKAFPSPGHLNGRIAADRAAWHLPSNARKVGEGPVAKGQVASLGGVDSATSSTCLYIGLGILAYAVWQLTKERA